MLTRLLMVFAMAAAGVPADGSARGERIPDLSGMKIVYDYSHPYGPELFGKDGRWSTFIAMRGPVGLWGTWRQDGERICVVVDHQQNWRRDAVGERICRDVVRKNGVLMLNPITNPVGDVRAMSMKVMPLGADDRLGPASPPRPR